MRRLTTLLAAVFLVGLVACDDPAAPTTVRRGYVVGFEAGPWLTHPDTVHAGSPFTVKVTTFGNGCVSKGETRVRPIRKNEISIEPFDRVAGSICTDIFNTFDHTAELTFSEAGEGVLHFVGLDSEADTVVRLRRTVSVQ